MVRIFCDKCKKELFNVIDRQESYRIQFKGGYGSVFGDGMSVKVDLCQDCLYAILDREGLLNDDTSVDEDNLWLS